MTLEPQLEMNYKDRRIILPKTDGEVLHPIKVLRAEVSAIIEFTEIMVLKHNNWI